MGAYMDLASVRQEYSQHGLDIEDLDASPYKEFERWLDAAKTASLPELDAMVLATATPGAAPSQRIVLLKGFDENGVVFFTNLDSNKARDIESNAAVSLLFPWHAMSRQIILSGTAERLAREADAAYFATRPRDSQLSAWASPQSRPIATRDWLLKAVAARRAEFGEGDILVPDFWGGYLVRPLRFEFWQKREDRLHDRFEYVGQDAAWRIRRLAP